MSGDGKLPRSRRAASGIGRRWFWSGLALGAIALAACAVVAQEAPREQVKLSVMTPDGGWEFRVREARQTEEEVWVWAELTRRPGPAAQQLTTVSDQVALPAGKTRRIFVTGKTWAWANDEPYTFLSEPPEWPPEAQPLSLNDPVP